MLLDQVSLRQLHASTAGPLLVGHPALRWLPNHCGANSQVLCRLSSKAFKGTMSDCKIPCILSPHHLLLDLSLLHVQLSDRELFERICGCAETSSPHGGWVAARASLLLQQLSNAGLTTRLQCLEYLGSHFRLQLNAPDRWE